MDLLILKKRAIKRLVAKGKAKGRGMNQNLSSQPEYDIPRIRKLITTAFSDEEFTIFCYDHFRPVFNKFSVGMSFVTKIQLLLEYCETRYLYDTLLSLVKGFNPIQFDKSGPFLYKNVQKSPFSSLPEKPQRSIKVSIPQPPDQFASFRIGNIEIPAMIVFGTPETPFLPGNVKLIFRSEFIEDDPKYPLALKAVRESLIEAAKEENNVKELKSMDPMPRIDNIEQGPERSGDKRGELKIYLSKTTYGSLFTTHRSLDYRVIPSSDPVSPQTIREAYCHPPYTDLSNSVLANCPGVDVALISKNSNQNPQNQLIIRKRSQNVVFYRGWYQVSATGYMSLDHKDHLGVPSPFITAITEARQEIADSLVLRPEDFKLVGLALKWEDLHPGFFGYIETNKSVSELIGDFKRDNYEGYTSGISFDPATVLLHIAKEKWHAVSALSAIAALLAFFPRQEVEVFAKKVSPKGFKDFMEQM